MWKILAIALTLVGASIPAYAQEQSAFKMTIEITTVDQFLAATRSSLVGEDARIRATNMLADKALLDKDVVIAWRLLTEFEHYGNRKIEDAVQKDKLASLQALINTSSTPEHVYWMLAWRPETYKRISGRMLDRATLEHLCARLAKEATETHLAQIILDGGCVYASSIDISLARLAKSQDPNLKYRLKDDFRLRKMLGLPAYQ